MDMSQIDPDILKEVPFDSHDVGFPLHLSEGDEDLFAGFTFEGAELTTTMTGDLSNMAL